MKNIISYKKYWISLTVVFLLGACNKEFLNIQPQDQLTTDNFYKNQAQVKAATASLYGDPWADFARRFLWLTGDLMSGNLYFTYLGNGEGNFLYFTVQDGNNNVADGWGGLYRVISYANDIMATMPPIASKNGVSQTVIDAALGEAHFMRGVAYFMLAELWGDVPIVENNTQVIASSNLKLPKNTKASVYELVRRDLEFAAANLPLTDTPGRVTQWSAKGMLAKLHLTMASNLTDGNSAQNFDKAKSYALDVITNSGLSLMPNYSDLFKVENNNNSESLFALQWIVGNTYGGGGNGIQEDWARNSTLTGVPNAFGAGKSLSYDFMSNLTPGDLRRSAILMTQDSVTDVGDYYPEINKPTGYTYKYVMTDGTGATLPNGGAGPVLNHIKKYVIGSTADTGGKVDPSGSTGQNQYILRLADVYLIYAEAALGSGTSTSDGAALNYFNAVHSTRAGLPPVTVITYEDILKERRVEFACEMMYWFDLKRYYYREGGATTGEANAAIINISYQSRFWHFYPKPGSTADQNTIDYYTLFKGDQVTGDNPIPPAVVAAGMNLPIPVQEVINDPLLAPGATPVDYVFH